MRVIVRCAGFAATAEMDEEPACTVNPFPLISVLIFGCFLASFFNLLFNYIKKEGFTETQRSFDIYKYIAGVRPLYYVNRLSCNRKSKSVNFLPKLVPSFSRVRQRAQTQYNCSATLFPFHPSAAQPLFHDNFTCCFGYS
mgnify:CR=1 FL=1